MTPQVKITRSHIEMTLDIEQAKKVLKKNPNCVAQIFGKEATLTYPIEHMQSISSIIKPKKKLKQQL
jgi:ABC-type enterochelin transport system substrate-binding protein